MSSTLFENTRNRTCTLKKDKKVGSAKILLSSYLHIFCQNVFNSLMISYMLDTIKYRTQTMFSNHNYQVVAFVLHLFLAKELATTVKYSHCSSKMYSPGSLGVTRNQETFYEFHI